MKLPEHAIVREREPLYHAKASVPATTANCGPGFDVIGMACTLYNDLELTLTERQELVVNVAGEGRGLIPADEANIAVQAIRRVLAQVACPRCGIRLDMYNRIPLARGLGSSAAAIVGGLAAANAATGGQLTREQLLDLAHQLEGHPDNVAPALYGGITVTVVEDGAAKILQIPAPQDLCLTAAVPAFHLSTQRARKVLPGRVPLRDAVYNVGRAAMLIGALATGQWGLLPLAFSDRLHHPYRERLIPGLAEVFAAARNAGALGVAISGAGPTVMAFSRGPSAAVGPAMVEAFARYRIRAQAVTLAVEPRGTVIAH